MPAAESEPLSGLVRALIQRREEQLEALYDAARDLTRIRDVDRTLKAVTERARRLLRCDVAYLSAATDGDDDLAVRAWSGQLSPQFEGTRVSIGSGVGGRVAVTRRPFQVADYQSSAEIAHTRYLDTQVGAEHLVALLGVPLEVDGRLLGILFAGNRHPAPFDQDQVRLLSSLAAHAAVALDNAHLFATQTRALEELEASAAALRAHTAAVETAAEVHARLTDVLLHGQGVPEILRIVADALDVSLAMVDANERLVARHGDQATRPPLVSAIRDAMAASRASGRSVVTTATGGRRLYVDTASAGTTFLGSVLLTSSRELTDVDVRTFERATQTIAVSLLADASMAVADQRAASDVVRQLLDVRRSSPESVDRLARRHLLGTGEMVVLVADVPADRLPAASSAAARFAVAHGGLGAVFEDRLVFLQPGADAEAVGGSVWAALAQACEKDVTLAVSEPTDSLLQLAGLYEETVACLRLMHLLGRQHTRASTADFGMYAMLFASGSERRLEYFVHKHAGPVIEYDARHQSELSATALAYLDSQNSPSATATTLGIHANTVSQRVARIDRLLGPTWRAAPRSLEVHTALRMEDLHRRLDLG